MPLECDDEYWENPDPQQCFKQPPAKPSVIVYFNVYIKLNQILAFLLRTIVRFLLSQISQIRLQSINLPLVCHQ